MMESDGLPFHNVIYLLSETVFCAPFTVKSLKWLSPSHQSGAVFFGSPVCFGWPQAVCNIADFQYRWRDAISQGVERARW